MTSYTSMIFLPDSIFIPDSWDIQVSI